MRKSKLHNPKCTRIVMPQTPEEFEKLVDSIQKEYEFPDKNVVKSVVAVTILHQPPDSSYVSVSQLAAHVRKHIANCVASHVHTHAKHETQVDTLAQRLVSEPGDTEARDKLEQAVIAGSSYARQAMERLGMTPPESSPEVK